MRSLVLCALLLAAPMVRAFEVESDLTIGRGFLYRTTDVDGEVLDGRLALGGGYTMVSDFRDVRFGAQARVAIHGERVSAQLAASWGPKQKQRGWSTLAPSIAMHIERGRAVLDGELELVWRRADAALRRAIESIDQIQLRAELRLAIDERWRVGLLALVSFYDPDLGHGRLRYADAGLAVTLAGRPERWALSAKLGRSLGRWFALESGLAGVVYADGRGAAVVPRAAIRGGPWRGFSVETSVDLVLRVDRAARDPPRALGGLALGYER
jgi:hypothetical protein